MTEHELIARFADNQYQELAVAAEAAGTEEYLENEFTQLMLSILTDAGEIDDEWFVGFHQSRGQKANACGISSGKDTLHLFYSEFTAERPPRVVVTADVETGFKRLKAFLLRALKRDLHGLEESSASFELIDQIASWKGVVESVRLYFLTDGVTLVETVPDSEVEGLRVSHHIWDIRRFYRLSSSGKQREAIEISFADLPGESLPCLAMPASSPEYSAYLAILPGETLAAIYDLYGTRLLERNVRAFLQARGKVNKGIRDTLLKAPRRFLAYNNGISATAAAVEVVTRTDGTIGIVSARDFQIVNGGQTTASIHNAVRKEKADVSAVSVQMKLSVVEPARLDELVPLISRFANSQNKVSEADFSANDAFHVQLEEISRTIWTPPPAGSQRQTRWFYERARGQYADAYGREGTPARKRAFQQIHPARQRFTKTDLAKFENSWYQLPHYVARGAEKNFREYALRVKEAGTTSVNEELFHQIVARAILFRETERVVTEFDFGGYRSQMVTYSIAYLSHSTAMRIKLDEVWHQQQLPGAIRNALERIATEVQPLLVNPPGGQNIAEWCKKEACWDVVRNTPIETGNLDAYTLPAHAAREAPAVRTAVNPEQVLVVDGIASVNESVWFAISGWAKQTGNLQPWQRSLAYSLGRLAAAGKKPTPKQATQGDKVLIEARRLGFRE